MRKTKKLRHQPEMEGIYLDELKLDEMDPEVAALYVYGNKRCVTWRVFLLCRGGGVGG